MATTAIAHSRACALVMGSAGRHCDRRMLNAGCAVVQHGGSWHRSSPTVSSSFFLHFRHRRHRAKVAKRHPTQPVITRASDESAGDAIATSTAYGAAATQSLLRRMPNYIAGTPVVYGDLAVTTSTASSASTRAFPRPPIPVLAGSSMLVMAVLLYYLYIREGRSPSTDDAENSTTHLMEKQIGKDVGGDVSEVKPLKKTMGEAVVVAVSEMTDQAKQTASFVREKLGLDNWALEPGEHPSSDESIAEALVDEAVDEVHTMGDRERNITSTQDKLGEIATSIDAASSVVDEASMSTKNTYNADVWSASPEDPESKIYRAFSTPSKDSIDERDPEHDTRTGKLYTDEDLTRDP